MQNIIEKLQNIMKLSRDVEFEDIRDNFPEGRMTYSAKKKYRKEVRKAYLERKRKERGGKLITAEGILLFFNILFLIPIVMIIGYIIIDVNSDIESSYVYNTTLKDAVSKGNNKYFYDFVSQIGDESCVFSPLASQNALYYGANDSVDDAIFSFYNNGYIDFKRSNEVLNDDSVEVYITSDDYAIKNEIKKFYGNVERNIVNDIQFDSNKSTYFDLCKMNSKMIEQFEYDGSYLIADSMLNRGTYKDIDILEVKMTNGYVCYFLKPANDGDSIVSLLQDNSIKINGIGKYINKDAVELKIKPLSILSTGKNTNLINHIIKEDGYKYNDDYENTFDICYFQIAVSDYLSNEEKLEQLRLHMDTSDDKDESDEDAIDDEDTVDNEDTVDDEDTADDEDDSDEESIFNINNIGKDVDENGRPISGSKLRIDVNSNVIKDSNGEDEKLYDKIFDYEYNVYNNYVFVIKNGETNKVTMMGYVAEN